MVSMSTAAVPESPAGEDTEAIDVDLRGLKKR